LSINQFYYYICNNITKHITLYNFFYSIIMTSKLSALLLIPFMITACQKKAPAPAEDNNAITFQNTGNPIIKTAFTADPATLVVDDCLYLFTGHDECYEDSVGFEGQYGYNITEWLLYSTKDMQNWTDHGVILRPTDFAWAKGEAWAAQVVERDGKFYYYVTVQGEEPFNQKCIGVAVSDSPTGPYVDAIGRPLITDDMTDNGPRGWWNDIDPTVLIDDDGTAWICWGNGTCFLAKLKDNMTELDGEIEVVSLPKYVEGPWLMHRGDKYYLIYVSMGPGQETISYAIADSMAGPWQPIGDITGTAANSFTIHPAVVEFNGHWYFFYHNGVLKCNGYDGSGGRRSVCVEELFFNEDGTIKYVPQTKSGVSEIALAEKSVEVAPNSK